MRKTKGPPNDEEKKAPDRTEGKSLPVTRRAVPQEEERKRASQ